jgi:hypothetical protein
MALAGPAFLGRLTGESRVPLAPGAPVCLLTCAPSAPISHLLASFLTSKRANKHFYREAAPGIEPGYRACSTTGDPEKSLVRSYF